MEDYYIRKLRAVHDAKREHDRAVDELARVQKQLGEFLLLNAAIAKDLDLSAYTEQAQQAQDDIDFYKGEFETRKADLVNAVSGIIL